MNSNLKKIGKYLAVAIFFMALYFNVKVSLDDPFISLSNDALAQSTSSSSSSSSDKPITTQDVCKRDPNTMCTYNTEDANGVPIIATAPGWTKKY
ncbi:hypothetical protein JYB64_18270 [Algoriphagus aestuarii]|nr:hypothetical protein [Algoriphagus aestuarii]